MSLTILEALRELKESEEKYYIIWTDGEMSPRDDDFQSCFFNKEGKAGNYNRNWHFGSIDEATSYNSLEEAEKDVPLAKEEFKKENDAMGFGKFKFIEDATDEEVSIENELEFPLIRLFADSKSNIEDLFSKEFKESLKEAKEEYLALCIVDPTTIEALLKDIKKSHNKLDSIWVDTYQSYVFIKGNHLNTLGDWNWELISQPEDLEYFIETYGDLTGLKEVDEDILFPENCGINKQVVIDHYGLKEWDGEIYDDNLWWHVKKHIDYKALKEDKEAKVLIKELSDTGSEIEISENYWTEEDFGYEDFPSDMPFEALVGMIHYGVIGLWCAVNLVYADGTVLRFSDPEASLFSNEGEKTTIEGVRADYEKSLMHEEGVEDVDELSEEASKRIVEFNSKLDSFMKSLKSSEKVEVK